MIFFSMSCNPATIDPSKHIDFREAKVETFSNLSVIITNGVWSPIIWKGGKRQEKNFLFSDFFALDFDDGKWTIADAIEWLNDANFSYIIGTTRSHQVAKGDKKACDRFRVLIPWHKRITDCNTYKQNVTRIINLTPADRAPKDGGRLFFPCVEIITKKEALPCQWRPYAEPVYTPSPYKDTGIIPPWLKKVIQDGAHDGDRNNKCFYIACKLSELGFTEDECIRGVMMSTINLPETEKIRAAKNGYKRGRKSS